MVDTSKKLAFGPQKGLWRRIKDVALMDVAVLIRGVDEASIEAFEERLLEADFGVSASEYLVDELKTEAKKGALGDEREMHAFLADRIASLFADGDASLAVAESPPTVVLVVGVNGAGKTTTVARLTARLAAAGERVLLAAADTFRAGALDQTRRWAERLDVPFVAGSPGGDPAAVVFDAVDAAVGRGCSYVVADTAGRLHTESDLVAELEKVVRVADSRLSGAPHEVLLCLDATTGQNALTQARVFQDRLPLTGLVVCKLDGTARGGVVVAVHRDTGLPVKYVGLGEGATDLEPFDSRSFAEGLVR